jgi:hypothetical protein
MRSATDEQEAVDAMDRTPEQRRQRRDYMRRYRQQQRGLDPESLGSRDESQPGRVEAAVTEEIGMLSGAESRPGLCAAALQMAAILDCWTLATTHPSACRQLSATLDKIRSASTTARGKLASMAVMTQRPPKSS